MGNPLAADSRVRALGCGAGVVSHRQMGRLLPDDSLPSIATALGLGAASSSCSYAAVALARSIFRKGAHFTAAMAFELASTNLVLEISIIMLVLLGWQLTWLEQRNIRSARDRVRHFLAFNTGADERTVLLHGTLKDLAAELGADPRSALTRPGGFGRQEREIKRFKNKILLVHR